MPWTQRYRPDFFLSQGANLQRLMEAARARENSVETRHPQQGAAALMVAQLAVNPAKRPVSNQQMRCVGDYLKG